MHAALQKIIELIDLLQVATRKHDSWEIRNWRYNLLFDKTYFLWQLIWLSKPIVILHHNVVLFHDIFYYMRQIWRYVKTKVKLFMFTDLNFILPWKYHDSFKFVILHEVERRTFYVLLVSNVMHLYIYALQHLGFSFFYCFTSEFVFENWRFLDNLYICYFWISEPIVILDHNVFLFSGEFHFIRQICRYAITKVEFLPVLFLL